MKNDNIVGINIAYYRKLNCLTQEELANLIGVSTQAVSKWEQQLTCPDIMLLPKIAKIFNITIDELFGIKVNKEIVYMMNGDALWNDDWKIRVAVYCGRKLIDHSELECCEGTNLMTINFPTYKGEYDLNGVCKLNCIKRIKN